MPASLCAVFVADARGTGRRSALIGAAFLMATSSIGPGFLTQTAVFTQQLAASFGFVILASVLLDVGARRWFALGALGFVFGRGCTGFVWKRLVTQSSFERSRAGDSASSMPVIHPSEVVCSSATAGSSSSPACSFMLSVPSGRCSSMSFARRDRRIEECDDRKRSTSSRVFEGCRVRELEEASARNAGRRVVDCRFGVAERVDEGLCGKVVLGDETSL